MLWPTRQRVEDMRVKMPTRMQKYSFLISITYMSWGRVYESCKVSVVDNFLLLPTFTHISCAIYDCISSSFTFFMYCTGPIADIYPSYFLAHVYLTPCSSYPQRCVTPPLTTHTGWATWKQPTGWITSDVCWVGLWGLQTRWRATRQVWWFTALMAGTELLRWADKQDAGLYICSVFYWYSFTINLISFHS